FLDLVTEHNFRPRFVHALFKFEATAFAWLLDRPSCENARYFRHVSLRVAAIHAQRVQLHQFAAVVFIQAPPLLVLWFLRAWRRWRKWRRIPRRKTPCVVHRPAPWSNPRNAARQIRVWAHAQPVIEVEKHCRALGRGHQQILKLAQGMRTNDLAL